MYRAFTIATDSALDRYELPAPGRSVVIIRPGDLSGLALRLGDRTADPIPMDSLSGWRSRTGWERLYLSAAALAGGAVTVVVGDDYDELGALDLAVQNVPTTTKDINLVGLAAGAAATLWTPAAGKRVRVMGLLVSASVASVVALRTGLLAGSGTARGRMVAQSGVSTPVIFGGGWTGGVNELLELANAGAGAANFFGMVWGREES